ncbi:MAG TPA: PAS domain-containing sensor histidine kinase [Fulvivirga sp.]|nr:PAS domain-containing sensor histidine kinase [Fulvivirga sp.]
MNFQKVYNLGIAKGHSLFEKRRIRLINSFVLVSAFLILLFSTFNFIIGAYNHALLIFSGLLIVCVPPLYFNSRGNNKFARNYFVSVCIIFINLIAFRSVILHNNRYNEVFMVGFSALIIIVCDNPAKTIYFVLTTLSTLAMISARQLWHDLPIDSNTYMAFINTIVSFGCIFYFTSIYKNDLLQSVLQIEQNNQELEEKEQKIIKQRDEITANQRLLRSTIDSLPLFIGMLDMNGNYLIANTKYQKTFGVTRSEIEGKHFKEILSPEILETHIELVEKGLHGEGMDFDEITNLPNGEKINSYGKYVPVYNTDHKQFALAVYVVDITKLKETESQLIALNDTKDRLLGIIGHDIRGPLNSLKGLLSVSKTLEESTFIEYTEKIASHLSVVTFSLDNLLNWAKTQMDGFTINPKEVVICHIINTCLALFEEDLNEKKISIVRDPNQHPIIWADVDCMTLVVRNLLSNAIKYSPKGSNIKIDYTLNSDSLIMDIIDYGIGIEEKDINQLQNGAASLVSKNGTAGEKGTGLGLSLCKKVLHKNYGELHLLRNKDGGTTARIMVRNKPIRKT